MTLYPHKEKEFWLWVSTWALFLTKPSDLGYPDTGYELPELRVHEEIVNVDNSTAGADRDGQVKMFREAALGLADAAKERRDNMQEKIARVVEIINRPENKDDHFLLWHDLEAERLELCKAIPGCKAVYGSQDDEEADKVISDFKDGRLKYLAAKPEMLGEGLNFQYHCHKAIMFIDYRFNDKFQAIARIYRFMQQHPVDLYLVYAESEGEIFKSFMQKWAQHREMVANMTEIVRHNGLFGLQAEEKMMRWMFASREEKSGKLWKAINNDNVLECQKMESNSVDLIVTSIPFSNHYEYTPTYNDFGHNEDNDKFFGTDGLSYTRVNAHFETGSVGLHPCERSCFVRQRHGGRYANYRSVQRNNCISLHEARLPIYGTHYGRYRRGEGKQSDLPFGLYRDVQGWFQDGNRMP